MPRAFDRGIPPVDKNPLISATSWGDPATIIGEAAATTGTAIQQFLFSLFEECVDFLEGLKLLGEGDNPLVQLGTGLQALIDQIFNILTCGTDVGLTPQSLLELATDVIDPLVNNVFLQGLVALAEEFGVSIGNFAADAISGATELINRICGLLTCNPSPGGSTPTTILDGISAVIDPIIANPFIQGLVQFAEDVGVAVGNFIADLFAGALAIAEALCSLVTTGTLPEVFGSWANTPQEILTQIAAIVATLFDNPIINGLRDLVADSGSLIADTISGLVAFINDLVGLLGQVMSGPQAIIDFLAGIFGANGLDGWIESLPFIGPLVSKLTGLDSSGDIALDLASLGTWAQGLLTNTSAVPAANLIGSIPAALLGAIPVSSINFTAGNLLSQGAFANSNTVEAGGGWAWDSTTTATGSGGSVKATGTGSLQQLYSRQTIKVAAGDRIDVTAKVKTSGFTSGSMVLSVVPWIGTTAQTAHVVHTRTTSASSFTAMTGSRLRIGGTAEAGEVALSGSITALTVRLAVTANTGASVWFDDVEVKKAGALAQTLVEYLTTTWEQTWTTVFGSGGAGKIWSDFVTAISTVKTSAGIGETGAGTNAGNILGIIDGIGQAVFGDAAYGSLPQTAKQSIRKLVGTLFGVSNPVLTEILAAAVPDLDGSIIKSGTVGTDYLDTTGPNGIGAEINPAAGSGAQISRRDTTNSEASPGPNTFVNGFYGYVDFSPSSDIQILNSSNAVVTGTGAKANLAGIYRVTNAGWYMVEICVKVNPTVSFGGHVAPLLYRSSNYPSVALAEYKTGGDGVASWWGFGGSAPRFVQSTFIVYLPANGAVRAGYSADGYGAGVFDADSDGTQTYFSISLLNKTYA